MMKYFSPREFYLIWIIGNNENDCFQSKLLEVPVVSSSRSGIHMWKEEKLVYSVVPFDNTDYPDESQN